MQLSLDSKVRDLYEHPLGHDLIDNLLLQMGMPDWPIDKTGGMRFRSLKQLASIKVSPHFANAVLDLLNSEPDVPSHEETTISPVWWKEAVFYQVCPRSFTDEGIKGIIGKLDYLREMGINAIRLSPIYDSPGHDSGNGIRDHYSVMPDIGTVRDMDILVSAVHKRGMKLIMDLGVNHTSDEHPWFQHALNNEASPCRDFYFFRKGHGGNPPNNWTSHSGGPAWNYYPHQDVWALHLFSKKQMDLNWGSPALRNEIHRIIRWWLSKGVDGFCLDNVNYISKFDGLPDGDELIGEILKPTGVERYFYGPWLHEYLRELKYEVFMPYNAFLAGATQGVGPMGGRLLTDEYREELDLILGNDHLENPGKTCFDDYQYDLKHLKSFYMKHLDVDGGHGWNTLFYNNHDVPRMPVKVDPSGEYAEPLAKALAVLQFTLKGTPLICQGDEIGARDHDMMQWDEITRQQDVHESVWRFYQKIIAWRKKTPACVYGALEFWDARDEQLICYQRIHGEGSIYVEVNLTNEIATSTNPEGAMFVLGNYRNLVSEMQPYEARVYVYF